MKGLKLMAMIALATALTGCQMGDKTLSSGIDLANLDTTFLPGTDFYEYATHGWQVANPLTAEYSRYGSFDVLQENNNKQLRELIDSVAAQKNADGSVAQKIADLYNSAMDSVLLNKEGLKEMTKFLALEDKTATDWIAEVLPRMLRQGVPGLFGLYIGADEKDAKNNLVYIFQGGLTMGQKDYYLDTDPETTKIREAYAKYIIDI